jgi:hypothetical protein
MKWSVVLQNLFIFVATLVVYWVAPSLQQGTQGTSVSLPTNVVLAALVPLLAVLLYVSLAFFSGLAFVRKRLVDKRAKLVGQYLSRHTSGATIAIFTIRFGYLDRQYHLAGDTYTTSPPIKHDGLWTSDSLEIDGAHLKYIYKGPIGGLTVIDFNAHVMNGDGHFIEDKNPPTRVDSKYARITSKAIRKILKRGWYRLPKRRLQTEEEQRAFVENYLALTPGDRIKILNLP